MVTHDDQEATGRAHARWLRRALVAFYVTSAGAVLFTVSATFDRASGRVVPTATSIAVSLLIALVSVRVLGSAWVRLIGPRAPRSELLRCVYASQPGKYAPGGVLQGAGQVAIAVRIGIPLRDALPAYLIFAAHAGLAAITASSVLIFVPDAVGAGWATASLVGLLAAFAAARPVALRIAHIARRTISRFDRMGPIPQQPAMTYCYVLLIAFALAQGISFAALLRSLVPDLQLVAAVGAYGLAFGCGLLAVPVPSGLVVRELVLLAVLRDVAPAGDVLTAAIVHRLIVVVAEVTMLAGNWLARRRLVPIRAELAGRTSSE